MNLKNLPTAPDSMYGHVPARQGGFTLIELMIAVAIVGIIGAFAFQSYSESVKRGRRASVQGVLSEGAQWMERYYSENNSYAQNLSGTAVASSFPTALKQAPKPGDGIKGYDVTIAATATTFTLTATRTGPMTNDKCGNFTLTNTGQKGIASQNSGVTLTDCWGR